MSLSGCGFGSESCVWSHLSSVCNGDFSGQSLRQHFSPRIWRARKSNVELLRIDRNRSATRQKFQLKLSKGAFNTRNPPLRDGDTVIGNRTALAVASDSINAMGQPLTSVATVFPLIRLLNKTN